MAMPNNYPEEFRRKAVALALSSDRSKTEVAKSLGITNTTLHKWIRDAREMQERRDDPRRLADDDLEELKRLRKEVAELRTEREILRKAAAYFARETK
jgi:transposase